MNEKGKNGDITSLISYMETMIPNKELATLLIRVAYALRGEKTDSDCENLNDIVNDYHNFMRYIRECKKHIDYAFKSQYTRIYILAELCYKIDNNLNLDLYKESFIPFIQHDLLHHTDCEELYKLRPVLGCFNHPADNSSHKESIEKVYQTFKRTIDEQLKDVPDIAEFNFTRPTTACCHIWNDVYRHHDAEDYKIDCFIDIRPCDPSLKESYWSIFSIITDLADLRLIP